VYVTNSGSGTVSVIAVATNKLLNTANVGTSPAVFGQFMGPDLRHLVGVFRPSDGTFHLDYNGSGTWEGCGTDRCLPIGLSGDASLVGKW
jgi:YVTN family beta-propeller protein